jgi:hypothetical protein
MAVGIRCADHVTPLYPQKLALTSPTGGGRSVGIVRSQTKAMELYLFTQLYSLLPLFLLLVSQKLMVNYLLLGFIKSLC